jgi:hypothetical protein
LKAQKLELESMLREATREGEALREGAAQLRGTLSTAQAELAAAVAREEKAEQRSLREVCVCWLVRVSNERRRRSLTRRLEETCGFPAVPCCLF